MRNRRHRMVTDDSGHPLSEVGGCDIALDQLEPTGGPQMIDIGHPAGGMVVDVEHAIATREQRLTQGGADKS